MKRSVNLLKSAGFPLIALTAVCSIALSSRALQTSTAGASIADASPSTKPHDAAYKIGSSDVLAITVWKEPEVSRSIPVRPDGKISLPLVGELQAAGRTPLQLERDISEKLKAYITNPDVNVMVQQINSEKFNVLGRVAHSGTFPLSTDTTVLDAIATAGGFLDFAKETGVYVLRSTPGGGQKRLAFNYKDVIKGKHPEQNIKLEPGDTVVVP